MPAQMKLRLLRQLGMSERQRNELQGSYIDFVQSSISLCTTQAEAGGRVVDSLINYETVKFFGNEKHEVRCVCFIIQSLRHLRAQV